MWLDKTRIHQVLRDNGMTLGELAVELGMNKFMLVEILEGKVAANRRQAETLLNLFGIWNVCWAMKDNWRWMPYAIDAMLTS